MAASASRSPPPARALRRQRSAPRRQAPPRRYPCWARSYVLPHLARPLDVADTTAAELRMAAILADIRPALPAAYAFRFLRGPHEDPHPAAAGVAGRHRAGGWRRGRMHLRFGSDQQEAQLVAERTEARQLILPAVHVHAGIERCADESGIAQFFELARDIAAQRDERVPVDGVTRQLRQRVPGLVEDRLTPLTGQMAPHLLGSERQDGREPAHHALGDVP